jgi:hypothetical protein
VGSAAIGSGLRVVTATSDDELTDRTVDLLASGR